MSKTRTNIVKNDTLEPHEEKLQEMVERLKKSKTISEVLSSPYHSYQTGGSEDLDASFVKTMKTKTKTKSQNVLPETVNQMSTLKKFKLVSWSILFFVALAFFTVKFYFPFHAEYVKKIIVENPSLKNKIIGNSVDKEIVIKLFRESAAKFIKLDEIKQEFNKYLSMFSLSSIHTKIVGKVNISPFETNLNLLKSFIGKATSLGFTSKSSLQSVASSILPQIPYFTYNILKSTGFLVKDVVSYTAPPVFKGGWFLTKASFNLMTSTIQGILYKNSLHYHHDQYHKLMNMKKM